MSLSSKINYAFEALSGITVGNINITGNIFQNNNPYIASQWTSTSGNTLTYTSGNVIISNGSLVASNLTTGNINFTGTLSQNGSPYIGSQWTGTSGTLYYGTAGSSVVGINTTAPIYTLDINGTLEASNANGLMLFASTGNLGIGTTVPSTKLDVVGTGRITTSLTTGALYSTNQTTTNIVGTTATITNLNIPGTLTVVNITSTNLVDSNITATNLRVTGTTSVANIYSSLGTISNVVNTNLSTSTLSISSNMVTPRIDIGGTQSTYNNNTLGKLFITGGQNSVTGGPNILITTTQDIYPTYNFLTYGHDSSWTMYDMYFDGSFRNSSTATAFMMVKESSRLKWNYNTSGFSAGATAPVSTSICIGSSGNVGLGGQVTPAYTLDVTGSARISSGITAGASTFTSVSSGDSQFSNLSAGNINFTGNLFQNGSAYIGSQWVGTSGNIYFGTAGSSVVGINTTSPSTTLDVTGTGRITTSLTTGALYSTNQTTTNIVSTNQTTSNITVIGTNTSTNSSSGSVVLLGGLSINEPTNATSVSNGGALTVAGGAAIEGDLIVGGSILYSNAQAASSTFAYLTLTASDWSTDVANGSLVVFGGISVQNTTNATSASSGNGLTIAGGVGIGADLYVGGVGYLPNIVSTTNTTTNLVATGISASNINVSGTLTVVNITSTNLAETNITTATIQATTGITSAALLVTGLTSTANLTSTTSTLPNTVSTNVSTATIRVSTGITSAALLVTGLTSTANLAGTTSTLPNTVSTNISTATIQATTGITSAALLVTGLISTANIFATTGTIPTLLASNVTIGSTTTNPIVDIAANTITTSSQLALRTTDGSITTSIYSAYSNTLNTSFIENNRGNGAMVFSISNIGTGAGTIRHRLAGVDRLTVGHTRSTLNTELTVRTNTIYTSEGSVGIGTTAPAYTLDVVGSGDFSTFVTTGALYSTNQTTTNIVTSNLNSTTSTLPNMVSTNITSATVQATTGITSAALLVTGLTSTPNLFATSISASNINVSGTLTVVNITSTNLVETNITAGGIVITGGSLMATFNSNTIGNIFTTGGNVGIKTTSPTETIHSIGKIRTDATAASYSMQLDPSNLQLQFGLNNNLSNYMVIGAYSGINNIDTKIRPLRIFNSAGNTLFYGAVDGNIGIGTTSPAYNLDVVGSGDFSTFVTTGALYSTNQTTTHIVATNITASSIIITSGNLTIGGSANPTITLLSNNGGTSNAGDIKWLEPNTAYGWIQRHNASTGDRLQFIRLNNNTESSLMTLHGVDQRIGILTTSPAYTLDVNGSGDFSTFVTSGALYSTNQTTTNIVSTAISSANVIVNDNLNISGISSFFGASFSANNNVTSASTVTGLLFPSATVRSFIATLNINISKPSGNLNSTVTLEGTQLDSGWILYDSSLGDSTGLNFTINSSGQVLYTSPNYVGWVSTTIRFEAHYYTLAGTYTPVTLPTSGNVSVTGVLSVNNTSNATSTSSGALTVSGGAGISKSLLVGENLNVGGLSNTFTGSFAAANNVSSATNVSGFLVPTATFSSFTANVNVRILTTLTTLNAQYIFEATQSTGGWLLNDTSFGDAVGITFTITPAGQIQYTSTNVANWQSTTINFSVNAISISSGFTAVLPTSGNVAISGNLTIDSTTDSSSTSAASLVLAGGVGINKSLLVGGNFNIGGVTTQFAGTFGAANSASGASVTGLLFPTATIRSFTCTLSVRVVSSVNYNTQHTIEGVQTATGGWQINDYQIGDASGITFAINSSGQITYTSPTFTSWTSTTMHYNAVAYNISSSYTPIPMPTGGSSSVAGSLVIQSTDIASSTSSGALSVSGGVGIQNNLIVGEGITTGTIRVTGTENSLSTTQGGALTVSGGMSVNKNTYIGGTLDAYDTVTVNRSGDGAELLAFKFNTERPWAFMQTGSGSGAALTLKSLVSAKSFKITNSSNIELFSAGYLGAANGGVDGVYISRLLVENQTTSNMFVTNQTSGTIYASTLISTANLAANNISSGTIFLSTNGSLWITGNTDNAPNRFRFHNSFNASFIDFNGGPLQIRNGTGGNIAAKMFINTNGNVGIGTTTPSFTLDITGTGRISSSLTTGSILTNNSSGIQQTAHVGPVIVDRNYTLTSGAYSGYGAYGLYKPSATQIALVSPLNENGSEVCIGYYADDSTFTKAFHMDRFGDLFVNTSQISFSRFGHITASGNISSSNLYSTNQTTTNIVATNVTCSTIRCTTSTSSSIFINSDGAAGWGNFEMFGTNGAYIDFKNAADDDYDARIKNTGSNNSLGFFMNAAETIGMSLTSAGTLLISGDIGAFASISDRTLKTNITNITPDTALQTVKTLRPVTFNWKDDIFNVSRRGEFDSGFIAQEVEEVIPHAVGTYDTINHQNTYKNMRHERIIPYLVGSIQKLESVIVELKDRIAFLESK